MCARCGKVPVTVGLTCSPCLVYSREKSAKYRKKNAESIKAKAAKYRQENRDNIRASHKVWRDGVKNEVFDHYGRSCACCGETHAEFLCIDHINGNGAQHRIELFGSRLTAGQKFYCWLKQNKYPPEFQVLCWNCNSAKHIYGICPHSKVK